MNRQGSVLFEAPLAHEHAGHCNCRECRNNFAQAFAPEWAEREWEATATNNILQTRGPIVQRVHQLLGEGVFDLSLLGRFASGQIWNEDYLALELLFRRQPQLRPAHLDTLSASKLYNLAVKHQRELKPIRESIVRPIFGNPANFQVGQATKCQILDLREKVGNLKPPPNVKDKSGTIIYYKRQKSESPRERAAIDSIVLHHMAYNRGNNTSLYIKVGAHYIVTSDGQIAQLYDDLDYLNASNYLNPRSIAIEFAGNFADERYNWWKDMGKPKAHPPIPPMPIPDRCYLTPAQIRAGRCLLATLKARLPGIKYLFAHRQSSLDREGDPGPDVWFNIGEWALSNLNLLPSTHFVTTDKKTGKPTGRPIPETWRKRRSAISDVTPTPPRPDGLGQPISALFAALGSMVKRFRELIASGQERLAVDLAYQQGITDENKLTDLVFFARHPELSGRRIRPDEKELAREWLDIRNQVVRPALPPGQTREMFLAHP